jgi:hypothetical protein
LFFIYLGLPGQKIRTVFVLREQILISGHLRRSG